VLLALLALLATMHMATAGRLLADRSPGTDAALTGFPLDDAWIHRVYSRGIARHGTPQYNDGEIENGFTSPLWMLLGAPAERLQASAGIPAVYGIKALGLLLGMATSMLAFALVRALRGSFWNAALAGALVALSPMMTFAELSGMEVCLAAALTLATVLAIVRGQIVIAGIAAALAVVARPEALVLVGFYAAWVALESESAWPARARSVSLYLLPVAVACAAWVSFSLAVTGYPLPNTYYVKYDASPGVSGAIDMLLGTVRQVTPLTRIVPGLLLVASPFLLLRKLPQRTAVAFTLLTPVVWLGVIGLTRAMPQDRVGYFYWWRYLAPAFPWLWIAIVLGLEAIAARLPRVARSVAVGVAALTLLGGSVAALPRTAATYAWNCHNVNEVQVELGRWVAENVAAGGRIAVNDAGALRYFGDHPTIDLMGLNRHEFLTEREQGTSFSGLDIDGQAAWLDEHDIDFLVVFPSWFQELSNARLYPMVAYRRSENYTVATPPPAGTVGQDLMVVFRVRP
jgi:hypothetical protein